MINRAYHLRSAVVDCIALALVRLDRSGEIALIERKRPIGNLVWFLPGGKPEASDNSAKECAAREVYEELGIYRLYKPQTLGSRKHPVSGKRIEYFSFQTDQREFRINEEEVLRASWYSRERARELLGHTAFRWVLDSISNTPCDLRGNEWARQRYRWARGIR